MQEKKGLREKNSHSCFLNFRMVVKIHNRNIYFLKKKILNIYIFKYITKRIYIYIYIYIYITALFLIQCSSLFSFSYEFSMYAATVGLQNFTTYEIFAKMLGVLKFRNPCEIF